jgi:hypothetical protein
MVVNGLLESAVTGGGARALSDAEVSFACHELMGAVFPRLH